MDRDPWTDLDARRVAAGVLGFLVAAAWAALAVSMAYGPEAIGAGAHLVDLGLPVRACPGCELCGLSRGFAWMIRGEVGRAVALNAGVLVAWPVTLLLAVLGPPSVLHLLPRRGEACRTSSSSS